MVKNTQHFYTFFCNIYLNMSAKPFYGYAHKVGTINGDLDPTEFSFDMEVTPDDLLKLFRRNEFIQIACEWSVIESNRQWLLFQKPQNNIKGLKFDLPYTFETFDEYLQWIDFKGKDQLCKTWSRLFGNSIMLFLDDQKGTPEVGDTSSIYLPPNSKGVYSDCQPYHPLCSTSDGMCGYEVLETDDDGHPSKYRITIFTQGMKSARKYIVDSDRVVEYNAPQKEIKYGGNSRVEGIALIALAEEQTFKRLMKRAHDLAGGILHIDGCSSEEEATALDTVIGSDLSSIDRIFTQAGRTMEYKTPDLKAAGEFTAVFDIFTRKLARHLRVSQQILDGAPSGTLSSAKYNTLTSYVEILGIQEHYRNSMEKAFHKLGKEDTRFIWNELIPDQMEEQPDLKIQHDWSGPNADKAGKMEEKAPNDEAKESAKEPGK